MPDPALRGQSVIVRFALLALTSVVVFTVIGLLLVAAFVKTETEVFGPHLDPDVARAIDSADCDQLGRLHDVYAPDPYLTRAAWEARTRIEERRDRLRCGWWIGR